MLAEKLANDSSEEVRYYLAFNRHLPIAVLLRLASDDSEMVRETIAWTGDLPEDAFVRLVDDVSFVGNRLRVGCRMSKKPTALNRQRAWNQIGLSFHGCGVDPI